LDVFFVVDAVLAVNGEGFNVYALLGVTGPATSQMQHLQGLQYRCSVGSGKVSSSTDVAFSQ